MCSKIGGVDALGSATTDWLTHRVLSCYDRLRLTILQSFENFLDSILENLWNPEQYLNLQVELQVGFVPGRKSEQMHFYDALHS